MDEPGRGFGAARFIFLYKKSNRKPFDQCSGHFNLYGMRHRCFEFTDELCGGCLSHEFSWDINGGESRIDNASFGDIVEACDGNVFGDFVAAKFQSFNRSDGNEIIVRKVRAGERSSAVYDFQHVGECALNRWREFVNDGFCSGHPVFAHRPVKTVCPFAKVSDSVGRAEMPRLAAAAVDEIAGGQVGSLCVVDEYAAAVRRVKVRVQKNDRDGELKEFVAYGSRDFGSQKYDTCTLGDAEFFDIFLEIVDFFIKLEGFQMVAVFSAFLFDAVGKF